MREYALLFREESLFISIDDKHKIKVGEPNCPVASAERGRRVPTRSDEVFTVMDHDFTKFGLIPSVTFLLIFLMTSMAPGIMVSSFIRISSL